MRYYPMHMHLHSVHQTPASMEGHIYNAHALGMEYIYITDHDSHTGLEKKSVMGFDFSRGVLEYESEAGPICGWRPLYECTPEVSVGAITVRSQGESVGLEFYSDGKRYQRALVTDVTLTLDFDHEIKRGSRIVIDILLSTRPPMCTEAHFRYVLGEPMEVTEELVAQKTLEPRTDGSYKLALSKDIGERAEIGGLDNAFRGISVTLDGAGEITLKDFKIDCVHQYNDAVVRQRALADEIGKRYGVKPFVTTEISGAGHHKNCYSTRVPVLDYSKGKITSEDAIANVLAHGGIFSYNHTFESPKYKRKPFTREELDGIVAYESESLIECRVHGAALMEIGFPMGRGLFTIADYLKLWDNISLAGIFITADGDSDSHSNKRSWYENNNFATWIAAPENLPFPIDEEVFCASLVAGNAYTGDPVFIGDGVRLTCLGADMGSVIESDGGEYPVSLSLGEIKTECTVRIIENGKCVKEEHAESGYSTTYLAHPTDTVSFVRAEAYTPDGRCIMLTNPIYFVGKDFKGEIPTARKVSIRR